MNILGLETSSRGCGVGLADENLNPIEVCDNSGSNYNERIFEQVKVLLDKAGKDKNQLHGIAVNIGPGSFTGLRVGIAVAKGLAHGLDIPLVGISTFEIIAREVPDELKPVCCVIPFKGEKITYSFIGASESFTAVEVSEGFWKDLREYEKNGKSIAGAIPDEWIKFLNTNRKNEAIKILQVPVTASLVAIAGREKLIGGCADNKWDLQPIYAHNITFKEKSKP